MGVYRSVGYKLGRWHDVGWWHLRLLDEAAAPTPQLAALCHQRWEIETAWDELKTHLRGSKIVLRSKTPELVRQEFWGLLLAHFAIRDWMRQAAGKGRRDPRRLS